MSGIVSYAALLDKPEAVEGDELRILLTDRRLVRVSDKKLVYSHIVGKAASFLSECCDWEKCPRMQSDWRPIPDDEPPAGSDGDVMERAQYQDMIDNDVFNEGNFQGDGDDDDHDDDEDDDNSDEDDENDNDDGDSDDDDEGELFSVSQHNSWSRLLFHAGCCRG